MITSMETNYGQPIITPEMREADALNEILRGEISAVESYKQVLEKVKHEPEADRLREFLTSHQNNVKYWERQVSATRMKPDTSSGPWGLVVHAFVGTAKLFGNEATLSALKTGEEHGIKQYKHLMANKFIDEQDKRYIRNVIIPDLERHLISIEAMKQLQ